MTAYQREKVQTIHTCNGPLSCVYICESLCRGTNGCSQALGRLGGTERVYSACQQENERKEKKRKENSPSKKKT